MTTRTIRNAGLTLFLCGLFAVSAHAGGNVPGERCLYDLETSGDEMGEATVIIETDRMGVRLRGAVPNSLYTVWVDFKSRATDELPMDYPDEGLDRGVAPAFASTAPVYAGMRLDPNSVVTDDNGDAVVPLPLDYNILVAGEAPVVHENLSMDGMNRVGGFWARQYPEDPDVAASLQLTDPDTGEPLLMRSTPAGITMVRHPDMVSHGHTPGVGDVDHFSAFKGDFPADCTGSNP